MNKTASKPTNRVALVTGVSRKIGIAAEIARRLAEKGARVFATGWPAHDAEMPWASDDTEGQQLAEELRSSGLDVHWEQADFADPEAPRQVVEETVRRFGAIDFVVAAHARSSHEPLSRVTAEELDRCWAINARASVLLAQAFQGQQEPPEDRQQGGRRLVLFTSGQHIAPMGDEIAYAVSKGAIHQMTRSLADQLIDRGITVNCINPGPVDTGYLEGDLHEQVANMFPAKRWGQPSDIANVVAWLCSEESGWVTGQVLDIEGGFRRWAQLDRFDSDEERST